MFQAPNRKHLIPVTKRGLNKIRHRDNERSDIIHCQVTKELRNEVYWPEFPWLRIQMKPEKKRGVGGPGAGSSVLTEFALPNTSHINVRNVLWIPHNRFQHN